MSGTHTPTETATVRTLTGTLASIIPSHFASRTGPRCGVTRNVEGRGTVPELLREREHAEEQHHHLGYAEAGSDDAGQQLGVVERHGGVLVTGRRDVHHDR